jgi:hypothetical protein
MVLYHLKIKFGDRNQTMKGNLSKEKDSDSESDRIDLLCWKFFYTWDIDDKEGWFYQEVREDQQHVRGEDDGDNRYNFLIRKLGKTGKSEAIIWRNDLKKNYMVRVNKTLNAHGNYENNNEYNV